MIDEVFNQKVRNLEKEFEAGLTASDTAEALAERWKAKVETWRVSSTATPDHDPTLQHLDLRIRFQGPVELVRAVLPEWERGRKRTNGNDEGVGWMIGKTFVEVTREGDLIARIPTTGISTQELEGKMRSLLNAIGHAVKLVNDRIDASFDGRIERFRSLLKQKAILDKKNEEERARLAQVADVEAVLQRLKLKP